MAGSTERSVVWSDATLAMGLAFLIAVSTGEVRLSQAWWLSPPWPLS